MGFEKVEVDRIVGRVVSAAVGSAEPGRLLANYLSVDEDSLVVDGRRYEPNSVWLVSVGKAAVAMARTAVGILGPLLQAGVVVSKAAEIDGLPPTVRHYQGSHPVPDEQSLQATAAVKELLTETKEGELALCLISGGTSALLTEPVLPLLHWRWLNEALLACGCTINEINKVRQYFDLVKGGGLAAWAAPAQCVSLILSDVIGSEVAHIGSGPTVPVVKDGTVVREILDRFGVWDLLAGETADLIRQHIEKKGVERPSAVGGQQVIIGDVTTATAAAAAEMAAMGFEPTIVSNTLTGEAREIGMMAAERVKGLRQNECLVWGGESTVTIQGNGRGGRNQEMALAAALGLGDCMGCVVAAFSTDGEDGPVPVAGAWVTGETVGGANNKGLDGAAFLGNNDSYSFFERLGWGHITAERGTNVNDVLVVFRLAD